MPVKGSIGVTLIHFSEWLHSTIMILQAVVQLSWANWDFSTFFKGILTPAERDESVARSVFPASLKIKTSSFSSTFL